jgi:hypothetical protein
MKILLDESLPRKLKNSFGIDHETWTVRDKVNLVPLLFKRINEGSLPNVIEISAD